MKNKIISVLLLCIIALVFKTGNICAMTEEELINDVCREREVNGVKFKPTDSEKVLMERYLNQYDVSSDDATYIVKKLNEVFDVLKKSGKKSFYDLSKDEKKSIVNKVAEVASSTSVDVQIVGDDLVIYVPNTNRSEIFYKTPIYPISSGEIAQTNRGVITISVCTLAIIGVLVALKEVRNA